MPATARRTASPIHPPTALAYPLPSNTTSTLCAATNAQYFYDYADQDAIDNYDLTGTKTYGDGGYELGSPWMNACSGLNFDGGKPYKLFVNGGRLWSVCSTKGNFGVLGACVSGSLPWTGLGTLWAFTQGLAKGKLMDKVGNKVAVRLGLKELPLAGAFAGCMSGVVDHYSHRK